jgi:hypothetical protein
MTTQYDVSVLGYVTPFSLLLIMVVVDEMIMVVAFPWMTVVADDAVLFVAVLPENPRVTFRQNANPAHPRTGFGPHTSGYWVAD